ncbi:papain-like cysteine protease family protein [Tumebacillus permanentifrigoris]|uniref:Papain like cysteine protease AvrRpt2 n=1 Tax=Tumebacillus permanentifrigoris TaxID=378543 RepID=A0A316D9V6_9BACL|nr:papain-like cysteine protease family protein [Tumebacillus permanentifrigoris]PWK13128.1 papain like cysteine protease AvrRpt2 [Tumebacillus permanentifrigoris]
MYSVKKFVRKTSYLMFPALLASAFLFTQTANAYVSYRSLSVPAIQQEKDLWCWAAATQMVATYFGANATQTDIVTYVKGSPINTTGTVADVQKGLSKYNIKSNYLTTTIPFQTVANQLSNGQPEIAAIRWSWGDGHALVIRGYYEDTSISKQDIYYIDPSNASFNIMTYSNFVSNSSFTWTNSVYAIYV